MRATRQGKNAPANPQVELPAGGISAGGIVVELHGSRPPPGTEIGLRLIGSGGFEVEHALVVRSRWPLHAVVHSDVPVEGAELYGGQQAGVQARLRALGIAELYCRAARVDIGETLRALRWRAAGKKLRARNILLRLLGSTRLVDYRGWLARNAAVWEAEAVELRTWRSEARDVPGIAVVVMGQSFSPESCGLTPAGQAGADWLVVLRTGERLAPDAVLRIERLVSGPSPPAAVTWDSDSIDASGRRVAPELKPKWNEALYLARDYAGSFAVSLPAVARGRELLPDLLCELPDALLLLAARAGSIAHIPRVLSHGSADGPADTARHLESRRRLVESYVRHEMAAATAGIGEAGCLRVTFTVPEPAPEVSLIVATRDRLDLLKPCVEGLRSRTAYPNLEIVIADNGSREARTRAYFDALSADRRVRIVPCPGPFNFAAINNRAAAEARGSVLGFINNDIEVRGSGWLAEMVGHALRPSIGAVGARLLYPSGLVQHAGVILGVGGHAGHAHRFSDPAERGYLGRLQAQQYYVAVTAACLVVETRKFQAVGGFDAEAFPVAYNDVDLCLRLRAAGFETLWTPYAELLHKESASRAKDYSPERLAAYQEECRALLERWGDLIADDPYYHPALSRTLENFSLE